MLHIYSILIRVYRFILLLLSPFNKKASDWINGRKDQIGRIDKRVSEWKSYPKIWIHAASYGEFEMAKPIIEAIKNQNSRVKFIVSFFSPSGYENIDLDKQDFLKIYLPIDIKSKHHEFLKILDPKAVIFIKYEFWFNFLECLKNRSIPYYFTSLHLNKESYLFNPLFKKFKQRLLDAKLIFCHNSLSLDILRDNGFENCTIFGDSRLDQVSENINFERGVLKWDQKGDVIAFGSVTNKEVPHVINLCNKNPEFKYIIATHDVERETLEKIKSKLQAESTLFSKTKNGIIHSSIIIVDTYGDLKYLYRNADLAYVGAGFEKGPHNVLEPLIYEIPTVCGSNIKKFPMAQYLKEKKLLFVIDKITQFESILLYYKNLEKEDFRKRASDFFENNQVNMSLLIDEIEGLIQ